MFKKIKVASAGIGLMMCAASAEMSTTPNVLTPNEVHEKFQPLFDGSSLNGFNAHWVRYARNDDKNTDLPSGWSFDAAKKIITTGTNQTDLRSKIMYSDFEWRVEYINDKNQGLFYRFLLTQAQPYQTGVEFAVDILTQSSPIAAGAAYGLYAPTPFTYKQHTTNQWNYVRIVCIGDSVEHWMNGAKIVGFKYHSPDWWERYKKSKWATNDQGSVAWTMSNINPAQRENSDYIKNGYLGFQGNHGGKWQLRSIRVKTEGLYFGPEKDWSNRIQTRNPGLSGLASTFRETGGRISLPIGGFGVRTASLIAVNGSVRAGSLTSDGKAVFSGPFQPGSYFLDLNTASGNLVHKLYIVP